MTNKKHLFLETKNIKKQDSNLETLDRVNRTNKKNRIISYLYKRIRYQKENI
jgi:hypothetical protein